MKRTVLGAINRTLEGLGYSGPAPTSIVKGVNALSDVLAQEDAQDGSSISGALGVFGEYLQDVVSGDTPGPSPTPAADAGKPVRFIDYDGTVLYSYTAAEFAELEAMPANPSHSGLIAQGWNWTLADAKAYVAKYGHLTIGQMYATESGATEIDIEVPSNCQIMSMPWFEGTLTYDWGDGSEPESFPTPSFSTDGPQGIPTHTYEEAGSYTITITPVDGTEYVIFGGGNDPSGNYSPSRSQLIFDTSGDDDCYYYVVGVRIGDGCTIDNGALAGYFRLKTLTIPSTVTSIGVYAFAFDYYPPNPYNSSAYPGSCSAIVIPSSVTSIDSMPKSVSTISLPYGITAINEIDCPILMSMDIPDSVTNIGDFAFRSLGAFAITFPESITEVGFEAFTGMKNVREMHVLPTTPPTTSGHLSYEAEPSLGTLPSDCVVYVPAASVDAYKAATGWSNYASKIQAEPSA